MSKSVDERVVQMQFDNKQFQSGTKESMDSLNNLNSTINNMGKGSGMSGLSSAVDNVSSRFSTLGVIGFTALQNLTNSAIDAGKRIGNALLSPIIEGGKKRALNIEQAKFQFEGLGMDVEATMADASYAVDGTAYSLDAAAKVASQLGASGMRAGEDMRSSLRAISGVAAMAGSSYEDIGSVFTKVAGQGRVMGDDLLRLSARGINAAATIAKEMGKSEKEVRDMVTKGQVDFKMFSEAMDSAFGEHATAANKTFTGSLANVKSALGRIGADVAAPAMENLIGVFNAFRPVVNNVHKALKPALESLAGFMKKASEFSVAKLEKVDLSGLEKSIPSITKAAGNMFQALKNVISGIGSVLAPIKEAFGDIFPPASADTLVTISEKIAEITSKFKISGETAEKLKSIFSGVFSAFDLLRQGGMFLIQVFGSLIGAVLPVGDGILGVAAAIGDFVTDLNAAVKESGIFATALGVIKKVLEPLKVIFYGVLSVFKKFVSSFKSSTKDVEEPTTRFEKMKAIFEGIGSVFEKVGSVFSKVGGYLKTAISAIKDFFGKMFEGFDMNQFTSLLGDGMLLLIGKNISDFIKSLSKVTDNASGILKSIKGILNGVKTSLEEYQKSIKAGTILKIAAAVGILALALYTLSTIPADKLKTALGAITVLFGEVMGSLAIFDKGLSGGFDGITKAGAGMVLMAFSVSILAGALKKLADIDPERLGGAMLAMTGALAELIGASKLMQEQKGFMAAALGLLILSAALNVMASAVQKFGSMDMATLGVGLAGAGAALIEFVGFSKLVDPKGMITAGLGVTILSAGLLVMASAVQKFGSMDLKTLGIGLGATAVGLLAITGIMNLMPADVGLKAVGILILSAALLVLAQAMQQMGGMSWEEIGKGLVVLGGALLIIAAAMVVMQGAIAGAAALMIVAVALNVLVPALLSLGQADILTLVQGIVALAAVFAVIGIAGLLLAPLVPVLIALGAAILVLGLGVLAAGAGLLAFSAAITAFAAAGAGGVKALKTVIETLLSMIPMVFEKIAEGIVAFAQVITDGMPALVDAFGAIVEGIITVVGDYMPELIHTFMEGIANLLRELVAYIPQFVESGIQIIAGFLSGIAENIGDVIQSGVDIVVSVMEGISSAVPQLVEAGFQMIIDLCNGIAEAINNNAEAMGEAMGNLASAMINGLINGLLAFADSVVQTLLDIAKNAIQAFKNFFGIESPSKVMFAQGVYLMQGLANGIVNQKTLPIDAIKSVGQQMLDAFADAFGIDVTTGVLDKFLKINQEMLDAMTKVRDETKQAKKDTAAEYKQAKKDLANFKKEQKIAAQRKKLENAANAKNAPQAAKDKLKNFDAAQEKKRLAAEKKALVKAQKAAKKADAAAKKEKDRVAKAKKTLEAYTKDTIVPLQKQLAELSDKQADLNTKLEDAYEKAANAKAEMDNYAASIKDAFTTAAKLTGVSAARTAQQYLEGLQDTLTQAKEYQSDIQKLLNLGLSQTAIDDIMSQGVETASATVKYLLDGADKATIKKINDTMSQIEGIGTQLGNKLAKQFYGAGVDAANGIVAGLESQMDDLNKEAAKLGEALAAALKKALEIRSPSRVMKRIGQFSVEGLIVGLQSMANQVRKAGTQTADILKDSMSVIDELLMSDMDISPTITPVIDFTDAKRDLQSMNRTIDAQAIKARNSLAVSANTGTETPKVVNNTVVKETTVNNNFNDRTATPVEVYNASKFGVKEW